MRFLVVFAALWLPSALLAQSAQIANLLESQLSSEGRTVEIEGFAGALTSEATMERLSISDAQGLWLELIDARLNWNRSALLRGRLEVTELAAASLRVLRAPVPSETIKVPEAEASGFRIPDLPVALQIERLAIEEIELGAPLLGDAVRARAALSATLEDGGLALLLEASRIDERPGEALINLRYLPTEEALTVALSVSEPQGGIAATALGLPGVPALSLDLDGSGPLDAFAADFRLATDGEERLTGRATLDAAGDETRDFVVDLSGDIRPLLDPGSQAFFGAQTALSAAGSAGPDGVLALDRLRLDAAELLLEGSAALEGGAPRAIALTGQIARTGRTALPGSDVTLGGVDLAVSFDATVSEEWDLKLTAREVAAAGVTVGRVDLTGFGQIDPGAQAPFVGDIRADVAGLAFPGDPALGAAVGSALTLTTTLNAEAGAFTFTDLVLDAAHAAARGALRITPTEGRVALDADLALSAPDLAPFSALAGRDLAGQVTTDVAAEAELPGGAISLALDARTRALDIAEPELAPLLAPETTLSLALKRDEAGTRIEALDLVNPELTATVSGALDAEDGGLAIRASLREIGLFTDVVSGGVTVEGDLRDATGRRIVEGRALADFGLDVAVSGALAGAGAGVELDGTLTEVERFVAELSGTAELAAQVDLEREIPTLEARFAVAPGVVAQVAGALSGPAQAFDITAEIADLAAFAEPLPGPARLSARVSDLANGPLIDATLTATPGIEARITGRPTQPGETVDVLATVADLGFLVPQLAGPARVEAALSDLTGDLTVAADITASPGLAARIAGQPLAEGGGLDLSARLADLGRFVPQLAGPATVEARVTELTGDLTLTADLTATPGLTAQLSGQPLAQGGEVALAAQAASLGFVAPQLAGAAEISARVIEPTGRQEIIAELESATGLSANLTGALAAPNDRLALTARIAALGRFVEGLSGGATIDASVADIAASPDITARLESDSGIAADVSGEVGLPGGTVRIDAAGTLPLAVANAFASGRALAGRANFDLRLDGQPGLGALSGTVTTADARLFDPTLGLTLDPIRADVRLAGGRADLDASAALDGVPIRIGGTAGLSAPFALDLAVNTDRLPLTYTDILSSLLSADIRISGTAERRISVAGDVTLAEVEIRIPDTGLGGATDIPAIRHVGADRDVRTTLNRAGLRLDGREGSGGGGGGPNIPLDIQVTAQGPIAVRGRGLDAAFGGGLRITGTAADPIPIGQFDVERGRLNFLGRRLDVDEGRILIAGALLPSLTITSSTLVEDVTANITLEGPVDAPELVLSSSPPLPEDEILARVLFGRGIETLSALQVARLVSSLRQLSGAGGAGVLEQARQSLGVDDLDLRTDAETGEAALAIGQTISENVYSEVEVGTGGNTKINLNFDLTDNTTIRGSASSAGETGLGIFWEQDY